MRFEWSRVSGVLSLVHFDPIPTTKYCFFLGSLAYDWLLRIFFLLYLYLLEREK